MTRQQRERKLLLDSMFALSFHPSEWWDRDDDRHDAKTTGGGIKAMYVYRQVDNGQWAVGYYDPQGEFHQEGVYNSPETAATRVHWLNGGNKDK